MKRDGMSLKPTNAPLKSSAAISILFATIALLPSNARAQNNVAVPYEAAAAYNAYNTNFLVQSGGQTYYNSELNSVGQNDPGGWSEALAIVVAEDNYEATHSTSARSLVSSLLNTFEASSSTDWSGDGWDDDIGWMVNSYLRGYLITGNSSYLTIAENNWNAAYNKGWDSTIGGGIYENTANNNDKECLSNDPFVWEGVSLYEITGDSSYLTKAENIYNWVRTHLFNSTNSNNAIGAPGQLVQGEREDGTLESGDNLYNSGSFLEAATALYHITGNSQYYNDAVLDINHVMSSQPIFANTSESPGSQWAYWFIKGLSDFSTQNNLWATYYPYLLANANAGWSERNSANLIWNQWTALTNSSGADADVMSSGADIWQLLPVPQQYQIINQNSNLAMDLIGGSTANNAVINQWGSSAGDANQAWSLVSLPNGNYAIVSGATGMAATISAASKSNGAQLVDWPFSTTDASMQFTLVSEGGGWYEIKNVNSGLVLDDSGGGVSNGSQIVQWTASGASNQLWKLQPIVSFGARYEIQSVSSSQALDVSAGSTANGATVIQWPYSGGTNQLWTLTPTSNGYYQIKNVNSGLDLNVSAGSFVNGGSIVQWAFGSGGNDQWKPVLNSDGTYSFYNLNSGLVLDNPGGATQGAQMDQWITNSGSNQKFNLIAR